jgi:carbamoyl-phosphate synthase/aspartate carbamoyltransferase
LNEVRSENMDLIINISDGTEVKGDITPGYLLRRAAVDFGVSLITNVKCAIMFAEAMEKKHDEFPVRHIKDFYELPTIGWHD